MCVSPLVEQSTFSRYRISVLFLLIFYVILHFGERLAAVGAAEEIRAQAAAAEAAAAAAAQSAASSGVPALLSLGAKTLAWARGWAPPAGAPPEALPAPSAHAGDSLDSRASQLCARLATLPLLPWPVATSSRCLIIASAASAAPAYLGSVVVRSQCWFATTKATIWRDVIVRRAELDVANGTVETREDVFREAAYALAMCADARPQPRPRTALPASPRHGVPALAICAAERD